MYKKNTCFGDCLAPFMLESSSPIVVRVNVDEIWSGQ
jgi:hypothetical protein